MMPRLILALFAFGFLLQSCTLQKRTLMPGWHLERVGQASTYDDVERPEPLPNLNTGESVPLNVATPTALDARSREGFDVVFTAHGKFSRAPNAAQRV